MNDGSSSSNDLSYDSNLIDMNGMKPLATNATQYSINHKNETIHNFVKIIMKYNQTDMFQYLINNELNLIKIFLMGGDFSSGFFKFDKDLMYLWFVLVRKHFNNSEANCIANEFVYLCLFNLLNLKQRNRIMLHLSLSIRNLHKKTSTLNLEEFYFRFNNVLLFVCLKTYLRFVESFTESAYQPALNTIHNFVFDFLTTSILIDNNSLVVSTSKDDKKYKNLCEDYLNLTVLTENQNRQLNQAQLSTIERLGTQLREKLVDISSQKNKEIQFSNDETIKIRNYSEALMFNFENILNLKSLTQNENASQAFVLSHLNLNLRSRYLLNLLDMVMNQVIKNMLLYSGVSCSCLFKINY